MKFLKLDKKKGAGSPEIKGKFAYLVAIGDIATFPTIDEKGVRLLGNITFKPDCGMIPIYLSSTSQEFSYDVIGEDDEKSYKVKFMGTHPGTELEALEFAKNQIEQPFLVLIPGCNLEEPWKLLGEITNPLIFTSTHKANRDNSKFTFTFEQRIGSEFIYFSYGGVVIAPEVPGPYVPLNGFWAKVDASNIDDHIAAWRTKLGIGSIDIDSYQIGPVTTTATTLHVDLFEGIANSVTQNGLTATRSTVSDFTFGAVSAGKLKELILHGKADATLLYLAEGIEGTEAESPDYDGVFIKRFTVTDAGIIEDPESGENTYKLQAEDSWTNIVINSDAPKTIVIASVPSTSFNLVVTGLSTAPKINGFRTKNGKNSRDGLQITLYNDSPKAIEFIASTSSVVGDITTFGIKAGFILAPAKFAKMVRKNDLYELLPAGETFDPTSLQNQITQLDDDLDIEYTQRVAADLLKLDKPTTSSDFISYPDIVAINSFGDSAKVPGANYDFSNLLFVENIQYMFPSTSGYYSHFRSDPNAFRVVGASVVTANGSLAVQYSSSVSTLAYQRGNPIFIISNLTFKISRQFSIDTAVSTQRVYVGISESYREVNPTNVAISTLVYCIAICMESGNSNLLLVHNDITGSANIIDTGFVNNSKYLYLFTISQIYGDSNIKVILNRYDTLTGVSDSWSYTIASDYQMNQKYSIGMWCIDSANTATVKITDFGVYRQQRRKYT
ncbi:MAG: hypothetical protein ACOH1X_02810 [Kaistella sp.]